MVPLPYHSSMVAGAVSLQLGTEGSKPLRLRALHILLSRLLGEN